MDAAGKWDRVRRRLRAEDGTVVDDPAQCVNGAAQIIFICQDGSRQDGPRCPFICQDGFTYNEHAQTCEPEYQYVCPNGSTVSQPSQCAHPDHFVASTTFSTTIAS